MSATLLRASSATLASRFIRCACKRQLLRLRAGKQTEPETRNCAVRSFGDESGKTGRHSFSDTLRSSGLHAEIQSTSMLSTRGMTP